MEGNREVFFMKKKLSRLLCALLVMTMVLDVDGDCGGFNLQWAWSSGYLAGKLGEGEYA